MATAKLLILSILLSLFYTGIRADSAIEDEIFVSEASHSLLKAELEQLKLKISDLELSTENKIRELKSKDETIARMEKVTQEKSKSISSLQNEIESLQRKGIIGAEEQLGKAHARADKLEKQVDKLKKEIETQNMEEHALESRASEAERKIQELTLKLQKLQKINDEQKNIILKTDRALKVAEEEMMKAKLEATSKTKELMEVHGAWLPPWVAIQFVHCQSFAATHWKEHGKPALDVAIQKALEKKTKAQKWAEPHVKIVKSRWIPAAKEQWLSFTIYIKQRVQSLTTKTIEVYELSKSTLTPHVVKVHELATPYFQEAKKFTKPYIDHVATMSKPHVDKARVALKPYTKKVLRAYRKFLKSTTRYHRQVQATVLETLNKHELTRSLATKELVWFVASALMALPILFLPQLCSSIFWKKAKKPTRNAHTNNTRRKAKRGHPEK